LTIIALTWGDTGGHHERSPFFHFLGALVEVVTLSGGGGGGGGGGSGVRLGG